MSCTQDSGPVASAGGHVVSKTMVREAFPRG